VLENEEISNAINELMTIDLKGSKIVTVSAKISPLEFLALERLSSLCRLSKSSIIREALRGYLLSVIAKDPSIANLLGSELLTNLQRTDGAPSVLAKCLESLAGSANGRPY